ncbi:mesoderm posterior protein 1-like [Otolemur garnettii]|uniref:mesoderm posterior protein 1-like n=1 Tax=Otolemur garnettii TaxID=30611 RepID=UPI000C7F320D|nr:mesoderm posterior protein 1-like [Otolemur garnettii]
MAQRCGFTQGCPLCRDGGPAQAQAQTQAQVQVLGLGLSSASHVGASWGVSARLLRSPSSARAARPSGALRRSDMLGRAGNGTVPLHPMPLASGVASGLRNPRDSGQLMPFCQ